MPLGALYVRGVGNQKPARQAQAGRQQNVLKANLKNAARTNLSEKRGENAKYSRSGQVKVRIQYNPRIVARAQ